jgi:cysteine desulfurase
VGKIPMMLQDTKIDMLSLSGHKLHAPKGIGVLYLRHGTRYRPLLRESSGAWQKGRTENSASIVGLSKACELALEFIEYETPKSKPCATVWTRHHRADSALLCDRRHVQPSA